jgi:hypothetical protein
MPHPSVQDVPQLSATDTAEYVNVLREYVNDWKPGEEHELVVLFPASRRDDVMSRMKNHLTLSCEDQSPRPFLVHVGSENRPIVEGLQT